VSAEMASAAATPTWNSFDNFIVLFPFVLLWDFALSARYGSFFYKYQQ